MNNAKKDRGVYNLRKVVYSLPLLGEWIEEFRYENSVKKVVQHNASFAPDERADELKRVYKSKIGHDLNLDNPSSYTEKIQWSKIYDCTELKGLLSDKYEVRKWITEVIGEQYLIPLIGVYDSPNEIDFKSLPSQFVIKMNNGSATNIIVSDKKRLNISVAKRRLNFWMSTPFSLMTWFEMHYDFIKPRIVIEQYMHDDRSDDLRDYKFLCFNGVPYYVWVDMNRQTAHSRKVFDMDWNLQNWNQFNYADNDALLEKPSTFEEMKLIASKLSQGFGHVRVDLYDINNKVYFGEMTFTNGSGMEKIEPYEMDLYLGSVWELPH